MFLIGVPSVKPIIGDVVVDSIAAKAQLPKNSEIIAISGEKTADWPDVNLALVSAIGDSDIVLTIKATNRTVPQDIRLDTASWDFSPEKESAITSLGLVPYRANVYAKLAVVAEDSPAEKAGFKVNDELLSIADKNIDGQWQVFSDLIKQYPAETVAVTAVSYTHLTLPTSDLV